MEKRQKGRGKGEAGGGMTIPALEVHCCFFFFFFLEREKQMLLICLHYQTP